MARKCRPSQYTEALADEICSHIAVGKTLNSICAKSGMPERNTVMRWVMDEPGFGKRYAQARRLQAEYFFDLIADAAEEIDTSSALMVQAAKLRIDTLKWAVANVLAAGYSDESVSVGTRAAKQTAEQAQSTLEPADAYQQLLWDDVNDD